MNYSKGKFIISGEHSVVYKQPALVCTLEKKLTARLVVGDNTARKQSKYEKHILQLFSTRYNVDVRNIYFEINSEIPQRSGLGSSAAFAHAVILELIEHFSLSLTKDAVFNLVFDSEVFVHKNPSGIDPFAVVYEGLHVFQKDVGTGTFIKERIQLATEYEVLLINSGAASETTGDMVLAVQKSVQTNPQLQQSIKNIGVLTKKITQELVSGTFDGRLLQENQKELEKLAVVGSNAKNMIAQLSKIGAYAKITGAGGVKTGSGWILVFAPDLENVIRLCTRNSWENIKTKVK